MPEAFLREAGWDAASRAPLAGDASRRRYERLRRGDETAILMIAPPGSATELGRFAALAGHLLALGLSAPRVLAAVPEAGLMLLEDLGDSLYSTVFATDPALEPRLYRAAIDCLFVLQAAPPPEGIAAFGPTEMAAQASLAATAWGGLPADAPCPFEAPLGDALEALAPATPVLMLRDFHAGNLFWLPDRPGPAAVGLIDFQDARLASPLYDVVSLLHDARRDVPAALVDDLLAYTAGRLGRSPADVAAEAATLSLQRNLRILGIFARLAAEEGKSGYLDHVPRVWRHIGAALDAPHLADLRRPVLDTLPAPTESRLRALCNLAQTP